MYFPNLALSINPTTSAVSQPWMCKYNYVICFKIYSFTCMEFICIDALSDQGHRSPKHTNKSEQKSLVLRSLEPSQTTPSNQNYFQQQRETYHFEISAADLTLSFNRFRDTQNTRHLHYHSLHESAHECLAARLQIWNFFHNSDWYFLQIWWHTSLVPFIFIQM